MKPYILIIAICLISFASAASSAEDVAAISLLKEAYKIAESLDAEKYTQWLEPRISENKQITNGFPDVDGQTAKNMILIKVAAGMAGNGYLGTAREIIRRMDECPEQLEQAYAEIALQLADLGNIKQAEDVLVENCTEYKINETFAKIAFHKLSEGEIKSAMEVYEMISPNFRHVRYRHVNTGYFPIELARNGGNGKEIFLAMSIEDITTKITSLGDIAVLASRSGEVARTTAIFEMCESVLRSRGIISVNHGLILAEKFLETDRKSEAVRILKDCIEEIEIRPGGFQHNYTEKLFELLGRCKLADEIEIVVKHFDLARDSAQHWNRPISAYIRIDKTAAALERLEKVKKDDPGYENRAEGSWYFEMSIQKDIELLIEAGDFATAEMFVENYIGPNRKMIHFEKIAIARDKAGQSDEAKSTRETAARFAEEQAVNHWEIDYCKHIIVEMIAESDNFERVYLLAESIEVGELAAFAWISIAKAEHRAGNKEKKREAIFRAYEIFTKIDNFSKRSETAGTISHFLNEIGERTAALRFLRHLVPKEGEKVDDSRVPYLTVLRFLELEAFADAETIARRIEDEYLRARALAEIALQLPSMPMRNDPSY